MIDDMTDELERESEGKSKKGLNPKKRGLGRGLGALFEDEEGVYPQPSPDGHTPGATRRNLSLGEIEPSAIQPREHFDDKAIAQLADSIKEHGLLQPIVVRPSKLHPEQFEIVAGERRWRAAQKAQLHEVPVVIRDLDDSSALQIALVENLQREDLNAIEEAQGYQKLMDDFDYSADAIGALMGRSRSYIANTIRLLQLSDDIQKMVIEEKLTPGHARALIGTENSLALANEIIAKNLSVRETEKLAAEASGRDIKSRTQKAGKAGAVQKDVDTLSLESEVSNALGMNVSIDMKDDKEGKLSISFKTLDQLDEALHRLTHNPGRL